MESPDDGRGQLKFVENRMNFLSHISQRIRRLLERRNVAGRFRSYVDPALVKHVVSNPNIKIPPARAANAEFVLTLLRDDNLTDILRLLRDVIEVVRETGGWLDSTLGSIVFVTFGAFPNVASRPANELRAEFVSELHKRLGQNIRIIHGSAAALVGDFDAGRKGAFAHYGSWPQNMSDILRLLVSLNHGDVREGKA